MTSERGPLPVITGYVISVFDLRHVRLRGGVAAHDASNPKLLDLYSRGFELLFYSTGEVQSLLRTHRYYFRPYPDRCDTAGASLLVDDCSGAGVLSVWRSIGAGADPAHAKLEAWDWSGQDLEDYANWLHLSVTETERQYPYLMLKCDVANIVDLASENAAGIGRLFTGGYEQEESKFYEEYGRSNLSQRQCERLLLRWTDGLALYDRVSNDWEALGTRGLQLFEYFILWRREFQSLIQDADKCFAKLTLLRPWSLVPANVVLNRLSSLEASVSTIPVQSAEAERLLRQGRVDVGLDTFRAEAKTKLDLLERRLQWVKAQWLLVLGAGTFVLNLLIQNVGRLPKL